MNLILELIKYMMIFLIGLYTFYSFYVFRCKSKKGQDKSYALLTTFIFIFNFTGNFALYFQLRSDKLIILYVGETILFILIMAFYQAFYTRLSKLLLRNMLMLLSIGFIILTRLSFEKAVRQVFIVGIASLVGLFVPIAIRRFVWLKKFGWIYGVAAILLLLVVLVAGTTRYGATNWLTIAGFQFQPSEFVKLLFVFCIASLFEKGTDLKHVLSVSLMAGVTVIILVLQRDLGGALIFFVTYVFMLYTATTKPVYLLSGLAGGSLAAFVAYHLFDHVKVRVMAWANPFRYIDDEGYQISQSLFAIGTGGWFGMGLNQGLPTSIPVVDSDFVFSAIAEELGGVFSIYLILIYISCFIMFINISLKMEEVFYRLLSLGFSVMLGFQVILSIGGVIKFIPSTGVTLPLISSGGTSVFATILMFMILQGIYLKDAPSRKSRQKPPND